MEIIKCRNYVSLQFKTDKILRINNINYIINKLYEIYN